MNGTETGKRDRNRARLRFRAVDVIVVLDQGIGGILIGSEPGSSRTGCVTQPIQITGLKDSVDQVPDSASIIRNPRSLSLHVAANMPTSGMLSRCKYIKEVRRIRDFQVTPSVKRQVIRRFGSRILVGRHELGAREMRALHITATLLALVSGSLAAAQTAKEFFVELRSAGGGTSARSARLLPCGGTRLGYDFHLGRV